MAVPTKIKVSRTALLERLREIRDEQAAAYENSYDVYYDEFEDFCNIVADEAKKFAKLINNPSAQDARELLEAHSASNQWQRKGVSITFPGAIMPSAPDKPNQNLAKLIRTLELSTEDTIVVSANDSYYQYL